MRQRFGSWGALFWLASGVAFTNPSANRRSRHRDFKPINPFGSLFGVWQPFGEQQFWETWYQNRSSAESKNQDLKSNNKKDEGDFSWYASWEELRPFVQEFGAQNRSDKILLPGIGMDARLLIDMYEQDEYLHLAAMDYAPAAIDYISQRWEERKKTRAEKLPEDSVISSSSHVPDWPRLDLCVADVRELPYPSRSFSAVLDKGTLDSVYLCGNDSAERLESLHLGVQELQRVLKPGGGLFWSLSAICADLLSENGSEWFPEQEWELCVDTARDTMFTTKDGYTSNNVDGSMLIWRKR